MRTWGIIFSLLTMAGSVGAYVFAVRNFRPWSRQTLAGAVASFQLGMLVLVSLTIPSGFARSVLQALLLVGVIAFFGLEIYLGRKYPYPRERSAE